MFPLARVLSHQNSPHTCSKTHLVLTAYHHSIIFLNSAKGFNIYCKAEHYWSWKVCAYRTRWDCLLRGQ